MARIDLAKTRQAGIPDELVRVQAAKKGASLYDSSTPLPSQEAPAAGGFSLADLLPLVGGVAGSFVPVPGLGTLGGSALGAGAGALLKQGIKKQPFNLGEAGSEAALTYGLGAAGGLVGKGVQKLLPMLKGGAGDVAEALGKGVVKPKVNPMDIFGSAKQGELVEALPAMGIKGSSPRQYSLLSDMAEFLTGQKSELLKGSTVKMAGDAVKEQLRQSVRNTTGIDVTSGAYKKVFDTLTRKLTGEVSEQTLQDVEKAVGALASKTFEANYTPVERLDIARGIYDAIDNIVIDQNPALKAIKGNISLLKRAAPGLSKGAKNLSAFGVPIPGSGVAGEEIASLLGSGMEKVANLPSGASLPALGRMAGAGYGASLGIPRTPSDTMVPSGPTTGDVLGGEAPGETGSQNMDALRQIFLLSMLTNPKQASTLKTIYDFGFPEKKETAAQQKSTTQFNRGDAIANQIENEFNKVGGTGRIAGLVQKGTSAVGYNPQATAYEALRLASIAPLARIISSEVGVLTDRDIARSEQLLPKLTDTREEATLKLKLLRAAIAEGRKAGKGMTGNVGAEDLSSLMQMFAQ